MKCIEYSELISAYVDEMLSPQEEEKLMKHLKTCQVCQKELEVLKQMQRMCQSIEEVSLPDKFHEDLMKRLKAENRVKYPTKFKWQYGGALVATMLVGILFLNQLGITSSKSKSTSEYATTDTAAEENAETEAMPYEAENKVAEARVQDEIDSAAKSEVAESSMQDKMDAVAKENQPESRVFMMQDAGTNNVWKVQVEDSEIFIEALKGYLDAEQIVYEQTVEGVSIYQVQDYKVLMEWLQEHSHSFEGSEVAAESNISLEIN